jgi:hypothetical protein
MGPCKEGRDFKEARVEGRIIKRGPLTHKPRTPAT